MDWLGQLYCSKVDSSQRTTFSCTSLGEPVHSRIRSIRHLALGHIRNLTNAQEILLHLGQGLQSDDAYEEDCS
ncbi:hypothetical protein GOP47_0030244 [Adiantum capillus-veneris]|nr:hypothetical protein GOP47_0030244 [Adiantum capillus-veneris]